MAGMSGLMPASMSPDVARAFWLVGNPTRAALVRSLAINGVQSGAELAAAAQMSLEVVYVNTAQLASAGVIVEAECSKCPRLDRHWRVVPERSADLVALIVEYVSGWDGTPPLSSE
jgi:hypothetical protein